MKATDTVSILLVAANGTETCLKLGLKLEDGEVFDASRMPVAALNDYFEAELQDCKENNLM